MSVEVGNHNVGLYLLRDPSLQDPRVSVSSDQAPTKGLDVDAKEQRDEPGITTRLMADYVDTQVPEGNNETIPEIHHTPSDTRSSTTLFEERISTIASIPLNDDTERTTLGDEFIHTNKDAGKPELINKESTSADPDSAVTHAPENEEVASGAHVEEEQDGQGAENQIPPVVTAKSSAPAHGETVSPEAVQPVEGNNKTIETELIGKTAPIADPEFSTIREPEVEPPLVSPGHDTKGPIPEDETTPMAKAEASFVDSHNIAASTVEHHGTLNAGSIDTDASATELVSQTNPVPATHQVMPPVPAAEDAPAPAATAGVSADVSYKPLGSATTDDVDEDHDANDGRPLKSDVPAAEPASQTAPFQTSESAPAVDDVDARGLRVPVAEPTVPPEDSINESQGHLDSAPIEPALEDPSAPEVKSVSHEEPIAVPTPREQSIEENDESSIVVPVRDEDNVAEEQSTFVSIKTSANVSHDSDATLPSLDKPDVFKPPLVEIDEAVRAPEDAEPSTEPETDGGKAEVPQKEDLNIPIVDPKGEVSPQVLSSSTILPQVAPHILAPGASEQSDHIDPAVVSHVGEGQEVAAPESGLQNPPPIVPVVEPLDNHAEFSIGVAQDDLQSAHAVNITVPEHTHDPKEGDESSAPPETTLGASDPQSGNTNPSDEDPILKGAESLDAVASEGHNLVTEPQPAPTGESTDPVESVETSSSVLVPPVSTEEGGLDATGGTGVEESKPLTDDSVPTTVEDETTDPIVQSPSVSASKAANAESLETSESSASQSDIVKDEAVHTSPPEPVEQEPLSSFTQEEAVVSQGSESTPETVTPKAIAEPENAQSVDHPLEIADAEISGPAQLAENTINNLSDEQSQPPLNSDESVLVETPGGDPLGAQEVEKSAEGIREKKSPALGPLGGVPVKSESEIDPSGPNEVPTTGEIDVLEGGTTSIPPLSRSAQAIESVPPEQFHPSTHPESVPLDGTRNEAVVKDALPEVEASNIAVEAVATAEEGSNGEETSTPSHPISQPDVAASGLETADVGMHPIQDPGVKAIDTISESPQSSGEPIGETQNAATVNDTLPPTLAQSVGEQPASGSGTESIPEVPSSVQKPALEGESAVVDAGHVPLEPEPITETGNSVEGVQETVSADAPAVGEQSVVEPTASTLGTDAIPEVASSTEEPDLKDSDLSVGFVPPGPGPVTAIGKPVEEGHDALSVESSAAVGQSVAKTIASTRGTASIAEVPSPAEEMAPSGGDPDVDIGLPPPGSEPGVVAGGLVEDPQDPVLPANISAVVAQPETEEIAQTLQTHPTPDVTQKLALEGDDAVLTESEPVALTDGSAEKAQDAAPVDTPAQITQSALERIASPPGTATTREVPPSSGKSIPEGDAATINVELEPPKSGLVTQADNPVGKADEAAVASVVAVPSVETPSPPETDTAVEKPVPASDAPTANVGLLPSESESETPIDEPTGKTEDTVPVDPLTVVTQSAVAKGTSTPETGAVPEVPSSPEKLALEGDAALVGVGLVPPESESVTPLDKEVRTGQDTLALAGVVRSATEEATSTPGTDVIPEEPSLTEQSVLEGHAAPVESESVTSLDKEGGTAQDVEAGDSLAGVTQSVTKEAALTPETDVIPEGPPLAEQSVLEGDAAPVESPLGKEVGMAQDTEAGDSLAGAAQSVAKEATSTPEADIIPKGPSLAEQPVLEGEAAPVSVGLVPSESKPVTVQDKEVGTAHETAPVDGFAGLAQTVAEEASSTPAPDAIPEVPSLVPKPASGGDDVEIAPLESEPNTVGGQGVQDAIPVPLATVVPPVAGEIASTSETDIPPKVVSSVLELDRDVGDAIVDGGLVPPESTGSAEKAQPAATVQPLAEETAQTSKMDTTSEIPSVPALASEGVEFMPPESEATSTSEPESNVFAADPARDSTVATAQPTADPVSASEVDLDDRLAKTAGINVALGAESRIKDVESPEELKIPSHDQNEETSDARPGTSPHEVPNITAPVEGSDKAIDSKDDIIQPLGPPTAEIPLSSIQDAHGSNVETESIDLGKVLNPSAKRDEESTNDAPSSTSSQPDPVVPAESGLTKVFSLEPTGLTVPLKHHDTTEESVVNNQGLTEPTSTIDAPSPLEEVVLVEPPTHTEASAPLPPGDTAMPIAKSEQGNIAGAFVASAPIIATMGVANLAFHIPADPLVVDPMPTGEAKLDEHVDTKDQLVTRSDEHKEPQTDLGDTSVIQGISPAIPKNTDATEQAHSTSIPLSQLNEGSIKKSNVAAGASIEVPDSAGHSVEANIDHVLEPDLGDSETKPSVVENLAPSETQEPVPPANTGTEATIIGDPEPVGPVHTTDKAPVLEANVPPPVKTNVSTVVESTLSSEQSLPDSGPLESTDAVAALGIESEETPVAQTAPEWSTTFATPPTTSETTIVDPIVSGDNGHLPATLSDPLPESSKAPTEHTAVKIETATQTEPITPVTPQVLRNPILDDFHTDSSIAPSSPRSDLGVNAITDIGDDTRSEVSRASEVPVPPTSPPAHDYDEDEEVNIDLLRELWKKEPLATPLAERASLSQTPTDEKQPVQAPLIEIQESEASTPEPFVPVADKSSPDTTTAVLDPDTGAADDSTHEAPARADDELAGVPADMASGDQTALLTPVAPVAAEEAGIKTILADSGENHVLGDASTSAGTPSGGAVAPVPEVVPVVPQPPPPETAAHESKVPEVAPANSESPSNLPAPLPSEVGQTPVEPEAMDSHERHTLPAIEGSAAVVSEATPEQQTESEAVATDSRVAAADENIPAASHRADGASEQPKEISTEISPIESPAAESHDDEALSEHNYELASATLADVRRRSAPPPRRDITPRSISNEAKIVIQDAEPEAKILPTEPEPPEPVFKLTEPPTDDRARLASSSSALKPFPTQGEDNEGLSVEIPSRVRFESSLSTRSGYPHFPGAWSSPIRDTKPSFEQAEGEFVKPEGSKSRCVIM